MTLGTMRLSGWDTSDLLRSRWTDEQLATGHWEPVEEAGGDDMVLLPEWKPTGKVDPLFWLFAARRGKGKTLDQTGIGKYASQHFRKFRLIERPQGSGHWELDPSATDTDEHGFPLWTQAQRVLANYRITFLMEEGPVARTLPMAVDENTGELVPVGDTPSFVWPCDSNLPGMLLETWPDYAYRTFILFDELAELTNHLRAGGRESQDLASLLRMIRKMEIQFMASTQRFGMLPTDTLWQVDVFMAPMHLDLSPGNPDNGSCLLYFYDWGGNFIDERTHALKYHDRKIPLGKNPDWVRKMTNLKSLFGTYETKQPVAPEWYEPQRRMLISRNYEQAVRRQEEYGRRLAVARGRLVV